MKSTTTIKLTEIRFEVSVETARRLLDLALQKEAEIDTSEHHDLQRKRAINHYTGASIHIPSGIADDSKLHSSNTDLTKVKS